MDLRVISSGSKGNTIAIISDIGVILVDLGLPKTRAEKLLMNSGVLMKDVCGVLISHEHNDHIAGVSLAEKYNVPVFASEGTFKTLKCENAFPVKKGVGILIGGFEVTPFSTYHNGFDTLAYTISDGKQKASVVLDTGKVTDEMIGYMRGSDIICIEANHCVDKVVLSDYPESVKARNLSDVGHLSNEQAAEALAKLVQGRGEKIFLCHLSRKCNTPAHAKITVIKALGGKGYKLGEHYTLEVV